jgi:hypothetical protein
MRLNISKSKFIEESIEYIAYRIIKKVFNQYVTKLRSILSLASRCPKQEKNNQLRQFIGKSEFISQLTSLTSSKINFERHSSHKQAFHKINNKKVIGTEVLL